LRLLGIALEELRETKCAGHLMALLGAFAEASGCVGQVAEGLDAVDEAPDPSAPTADLVSAKTFLHTFDWQAAGK
jgi:hypothetical protein